MFKIVETDSDEKIHWYEVTGSLKALLNCYEQHSPFPYTICVSNMTIEKRAKRWP